MPPNVSTAGAGYPIVQSLAGRWKLRDDNPNEWAWTGRALRQHDLSEWMDVVVPASVQEALLRAGRIAHPYRDLNSRAAEWVEHRDWVFGLNFSPFRVPPTEGERVFLGFQSVDDACLVFLNGILVCEHEGPGTPFSVEVGPLLRKGQNQLLVAVSAPQPEHPQTGWTEQTRSVKGRMGYGWDFAPRLVRVGILGPAGLRYTGPHRLRDLWVRTALADDARNATLQLRVEADGPPGATVHFSVMRGTQTVATSAAVRGADGFAQSTVELSRPRIWWPNGSGGQPLYKLRAECEDGSDRLETTFGIRDLHWEVRPDGAPGEWPLMLVVNGQPLFQRGWNWVPADAMGGPRTQRNAGRLLRLAHDAGVNILRCWGGGDPQSSHFYDECDRLGILVWQELPLSSAGISNTPPSDAGYLDRAEKYARAVVAARRNHPSLALWDGGNELTEADGTPLTPGHPYARRMRAVIEESDPDRAFRPSSPLGPNFAAEPGKSDLWDVHGPWEYGSGSPEHGEGFPGPQYGRLNSVRPILHSELGAPAEASVDSQRHFLSTRYRSRLPANPARRHHGGAWWEHQATVERLFGPIDDSTLAVLASQWLQAEALRYYIEETRRRWHESVGIYPWQLNEPWPNVVCTSAVEYGGKPKLAYYAVRSAYRPTIATARYPGLTFAPGGPLRAEVWLVSDAPELDGELAIAVRDLEGRELVLWSTHPVHAAARSSAKLLDLELPLPAGYEGVAVLELSLAGQSNAYLFSNRTNQPFCDALQVPGVLLDMFAAGDKQGRSWRKHTD